MRINRISIRAVRFQRMTLWIITQPISILDWVKGAVGEGQTVRLRESKFKSHGFIITNLNLSCGSVCKSKSPNIHKLETEANAHKQKSQASQVEFQPSKVKGHPTEANWKSNAVSSSMSLRRFKVGADDSPINERNTNDRSHG